MFELSGSQFEKGQLEIRLRRQRFGWLSPLMALGPIRGRFLVLGVLLFSAFGTVQRQPGNLFITNGWVHSPEAAAMVQNIFSWGLSVVAVLLWLVFLVFQEESLVLCFDKTKSELKTHFTPWVRQKVSEQGLFPFKHIQSLKVTKANADAPFGSVAIYVKDSDKNEKKFEFKFLTDEQFQFFPLNMYRITQIEPTGDWIDPDNS